MATKFSKKSSSSTTTTTTTTETSQVSAQLQQIESTCGFEEPLADADRKATISVVRRVSPEAIDRVMTLAVRSGGVVAGIDFDPDKKKQALAEADTADAIAAAGANLVRRAQDHALRIRAEVAQEVLAARASIRGFARTAQGVDLRQEVDAMRGLATREQGARKARRTRVVNEVTTGAAGNTGSSGNTPAQGAAAAPPTATGATTATSKPN